MICDTVRTEVQGNVFVVTLDRPHLRNAIDFAMAAALEATWDAFEADPSLRVAVLHGAGGCFSAGADLKAASLRLPPARTERRGAFGTTAQPPNKPLIASVDGDAMGGGFELVLACDLVVASRTSRFGLPECRRGVMAVGGGLVRLPGRLPSNVAAEMAFTGQPQLAERLFELGFVNRLAEPGCSLSDACQLAEIIAANAPLSVGASKRVMRAVACAGEEAGWACQSGEIARIRESADYREGISAFVEKRPPRWQGR